jgi:hypothetical protein
MRHQFDLVVIGTGTAAGVVAHKCRRAGWSVAVIDSRPFGGTCALRGCDPKKVLVGAAEAVDQVNRLRGKGVRADALRVEWSELMRFKRGMIEAVPAAREDGFARAGIVHDPTAGIRGAARKRRASSWPGFRRPPRRHCFLELLPTCRRDAFRLQSACRKTVGTYPRRARARSARR